MAFPSTVLSLVIACTSAYSLYHSSLSIPKLRKYEAKAEKAAKWSNTAEKRLWDTRYTVGAGFAMTLTSLLSALYLALFSGPSRGFFGILRLAALCLGEFATSGYLRSFWAKERKVPLMDEYNEAISHSLEVMALSDALAYLWGVETLLSIVGY
ncbi:hypothetical protein B0T16DRAFT_463494 [Cercophora newfieldiana]|uniref:Uncharacterized protein n=1 Tax=Cercophora newfieldiana TaxID=92897 RepID=A0AA39XTB8_9PEZI|nr:hypothetical protein B0T16DRAFT_463494 [Cercophora newfieldiana]